MIRNKIKRGLIDFLQFSLNRKGIEVFERLPDYHYVPDHFGRAALKGINIRKLNGFAQLADKVIGQGRTLLYYDRLYVLYQCLQNLKRLFGERSDLNMAEVGVYKGGTSYFLASASDLIGLKAVPIHCFDTFEGHVAQDLVSGYDSDRHVAHFFGDTDFAAVKAYLDEFSNIKLYQGRIQDTCFYIQEKTFGFIHLDVDLYEPTRFALDFFDPRLIIGGIIVIDDFGVSSCPGIKKAFVEFLNDHPNYFFLNPLTEQCVLLKNG